MNFFTYGDNGIELNKPEILLVKEFSDLFSLKFNAKEAGDVDGRKRLRAYKVLQFIYLMYDWKSPYSEMSEKERYEATMEDCDIEVETLEKPEVIAAIKKYLEVQDSRLVKLLKSAHSVVDKLRHYFDELDLMERDGEGRPLFSAKDALANLASLSKTVDSLQQLEHLVKKEKEQEKGLRGQAESGLFDTMSWE